MAKVWTLPTDREPLEHDEQKDFIRWFRRTFPGVVIYAVPNGGKRGKREAEKLKMEGVLAGVFDMHVLDWDLYIEMKRQKSGRLSPPQKAFKAKLIELGRPWMVTRGSADAQEQVKAFALSHSIAFDNTSDIVPSRDKGDRGDTRDA